MAAPPLRALQEALTGAGAGEAADPQVLRRLDDLRRAVGQQDLPAEVADAVCSFLRHTGLDQVPLAVRSSAGAEDSPAASFAGVHQSFLKVQGEGPVLQAVKGCYASLWTPQALAYRRRLRLADADVACAVVLCALVPARAAGVAFSCDPRTGRRDLVTISAGPGLAEDLVAGRTNPEEVAVTQARGHLYVTRRRGQAGPVLSDKLVLELARLTLRVHWALGEGQEPQDVEWAHDGRRFWLLQARPVTRLPHVTFPALAGSPVLWSNANLKDCIPGVPTPGTWSALQPALWEILYAAPEAAGYPLPRGMEMIRRFAGRLYFDLGALQWVFYDCLGLLPADTNRSLGGHQPAIAVPPGSPFRGRAGWARLRANARLLRILLSIGRKLPPQMSRLRAAARRARALDLGRLSNAQLLDLIYLLGDWGPPFGRQFQLGNAAAGGWQTALVEFLGWLLPGRGPALAAALLAGSGRVTTAAQGYRLLAVADAARRDPEALDYLGREPLDPHGWRLLPGSSPFRRAMERFLDEFGHRAVYEVEIANPRWNEDPTYLLEQVRYVLGSPPARPPQEAAWAARAAAEAEVARHTFFLRPVVAWLAARAREGAALREAGKSTLVALYEPMRYALLEIGRRLARAGLLWTPSDVFFLTWMDVQTYLRGEWDGRGAPALVADRRARAEAWEVESPPDFLVVDAEGRPAALPAVAVSPLPLAAAAGTGGLAGIAASAGRASGPARVLRHPGEGHRLRAGDVLVAPSTDPGWTPLFLRASALAVEVGGYLSHGAIVAREYGLPAVVNVPGLLDAVRDGQRLTVDGNAGRVLIEG
jgi:pyruvate,water dikinase